MPQDETVDLTTLSFKELKAEAEARKIDTKGMRSKQALIDAITEYEEKTPEKPPEVPESPKTPKEPKGSAKAPEKPSERSEEGSGAEVPDGAKVEVKGIDIKGPIDTLDKHGNYICTYCEETHGKGYRKLVEEFVGPQPTDAPEINKGRTAVPHDTSVMVADVVDAEEKIRMSFTRKEHGIHFRQMAMAHCSGGLAKLVKRRVGGEEIKEERPDEIIPARVELRRN